MSFDGWTLNSIIFLSVVVVAVVVVALHFLEKNVVTVVVVQLDRVFCNMPIVFGVNVTQNKKTKSERANSKQNIFAFMTVEN
jgi:hypothetical protein